MKNKGYRKKGWSFGIRSAALLGAVLLLAGMLAGLLAGCGQKERTAGDGSGEIFSETIESAAGQRESERESKQETEQETRQEQFQLPDIVWRLAAPIYEKLDDVVYGYSITDFDVEPGSGEDITNKMQAALLLLKNKGGGTLYLPAGEYVLEGTVNVPKGVTICGDWKEPTPEDKTIGGTVLLVYAGRGKSVGTAQFILQPNSCIRDLTIYYPEQTVEDIQPYPATIQLYDPSVWGADYTHVNNVTLINSYIGVVQGPNGNGCPNVHNLYGTPLCTGLSMDGSADVGRCDYISLSADYWVESGYFGNQDEEALRSYLYENAVGISIGRVDWSYYANTHVEGYAIGMRLREGELSEAGRYPNGQVYRHTYENCRVGLQVDGTSSAGEEFAELQIINCDIGIHVDDNAATANGQLQFYRTVISAQTYAVLHEGEEDVCFLDCQVAEGEVCARKGTLLLASAQADQVTGARIIRTDCTELPEVRTAPDMNTPVHKAARSVLYVYDKEPSDEEDQTESIQAFLDHAAEEGGGIAFIPPGEYCISGNLTVAEGVELKGAIDVGRNPIRMGTIFRVREGADADSATVLLEKNSGICGIVFDYPEQDFTAPSPYPYTIRGNGENIFIVNVSLRGAYNGVDLMTNRCDNHYVEYLSGICMENTIQVGGGSVGGRIYNYQMNFIIITAGEESKFGSWDNSPVGSTEAEEEAALKKYLQEHLVVLRVGHVEDEMLYDNFSYNGWRGVQFIEENGRGASGWSIGHGVDYSTVAFDIQALEDMGFINTQLVSYRDAGTEAEQVSHILVEGDVDVEFVNTSCWAKPDTSNLYVGQGKLSVWNMHIHNVPSVSLCAEEGGELYLVNATYDNSGEFYLAYTQEGGITVEGMAYASGIYGVENATVRNAHNRRERIDIPDNALNMEGTVLMAEGFTDHPAMGGEKRYLNAGGNFDKLQPPSEDAYVELVEEDGIFFARLFCSENANSAYLRDSSLMMDEGGTYELEMRFNIASVNQNRDYGMMCSVEGIGATGVLGTELLFGCYGDHSFSVRGESLYTWEEDVWYRVKILFVLQGSDRRFEVSLLDDEGVELASGGGKLRDALQGDCALGNLQIAMIGSAVSGSGENDMYLDYCQIVQRQ